MERIYIDWMIHYNVNLDQMLMDCMLGEEAMNKNSEEYNDIFTPRL